jgi:hypothetical protein
MFMETIVTVVRYWPGCSAVPMGFAAPPEALALDAGVEAVWDAGGEQAAKAHADTNRNARNVMAFLPPNSPPTLPPTISLRQSKFGPHQRDKRRR